MFFDSSVKKLIDAAYHEKKDVFLQMPFPDIKDVLSHEIKTAVLLPGAFFGAQGIPFSDVRCGAAPGVYEKALSLVVADIRFMGDTAFRSYLHGGGFSRLVIPFAECADEAEYGYRQAYAWIGEYKAETADFCQTIAFFRSSYGDFQYYMSLFDCRDVISVGNGFLPDVRVYKASSVHEKFLLTAKETEKYTGKKICIFLNSRNEASDLSRYLIKRGIKHLYFHGGLTLQQKKEIIERYSSGEAYVLLVTKSFISETIYTASDKCIICGAPFSLAHLCRCSAATSDLSSLVIYCENDIIRNGKISLSFAESCGNSKMFNERQKRLCETKNFFERGL